MSSQDRRRLGLPALPPELWRRILHFAPRSTVAALCRTSSPLHHLAIPVLYRSIPQLTLERSRTICQYLLLHPDVAAHVEHLHLVGAQVEEDASVNTPVLELLRLPELRSRLRSFGWSYHEEKSQREGNYGWPEPAESLKDNAVWEELAEGFPNLEAVEVTGLAMELLEDGRANSLYRLRNLQRISITTQEHMHEGYVHGDEDPYTTSLFDFLTANVHLTHLTLCVRFNKLSYANPDAASITSLFLSARWPALAELTLEGCECSDAEWDDSSSKQFGPAKSAQEFFAAHPTLRRLRITASPENEVLTERTVPLVGLAPGTLPALERIESVRENVEALFEDGAQRDALREVIVIGALDDLGNEDGNNDWDTFRLRLVDSLSNALALAPNLLALEIDFALKDDSRIPDTDRPVFERIAAACPQLKRLHVSCVADWGMKIGTELSSAKALADKLVMFPFLTELDICEEGDLPSEPETISATLAAKCRTLRTITLRNKERDGSRFLRFAVRSGEDGRVFAECVEKVLGDWLDE